MKQISKIKASRGVPKASLASANRIRKGPAAVRTRMSQKQKMREIDRAAKEHRATLKKTNPRKLRTETARQAT